MTIALLAVVSYARVVDSRNETESVEKPGGAVTNLNPKHVHPGQKLWPIRGLMFSYYATMATLTAFLPLYLSQKGFHASQIGLLMMIGPFASIFIQPFWGYISDRFQRIKLLILGLWLFSIAISIGVFEANHFWTMFACLTLLYCFVLPSQPLLDSLIIQSIENSGRSYGSFRMWGSIGLCSSALFGGAALSELGGIQHLSYLYWGIWILPLAFILLFKDSEPAPRVVTSKALVAVCRNPSFLWFLFFVFVLMVPNRMNDALFVVYLQDLGASNVMAGWSWALAAGSEIIIFGFLSRYVNEWNPYALLGVSATLFTLRWIVYSLISDPHVLVWFQASHAITFGLFWMVAIRITVTLVPKEFTSLGQTLLSAVFMGAAGISGGFVGGYIKDSWGGPSMYLFGAALSTVSIVILFGYLWSNLRRKDRHLLQE